MLAIETVRLSKRYGRNRGIEEVSLSVHPGEVFGFLGPNGAGKTTTIRLLLGFLRPTAGEGRVFGLEIRRDSLRIRRRSGYLPGDVNLYPNMRGREIVELSLASRGLGDQERASMLAERLDLDLDRRIKHCSKGMRQKVAIIAALAHDPDLVVLDEPTTALDPLIQHSVGELLHEIAGRGKTVFLSSHNLTEVESLCERVAIIREGRVVAVDEVAALRRMRMKHVIARFEGEPPILHDLPGVQSVKHHKDRDERVVLHASGDLRPLLSRLAASHLVDLRIEDQSLEEIFLTFYSSAEGGTRG